MANLRWNFRIGPLQFTAPVTIGAVVVIVLCCCGSGLIGTFTDSGESPDTTSVVSTPTTAAAHSPKPSSSKKATPKPAASTKKPPKTDPRFDTCAEANANGYGPYRKGTDTEYEWYRDRDGDGVVCERR